MDLKKLAAQETAALHLQDAGEEPIYADGEGGKPDLSKPVRVHMHSPGTRQYAKAAAKRNSRLMERMRKGKKIDLSAEEQRLEAAEFLADTTEHFENMTYDGKSVTTREDFIAVYSDIGIGFIAEQAGKFGADWVNFQKKSPIS